MPEEEKRPPSAESEDDALMDLLFEEEEGGKKEEEARSAEVGSEEQAKETENTKEEAPSEEEAKEEAPVEGAEGKSGEEGDSQGPEKEETKDLIGPEEDPLAEILGEEGPEEAEKPSAEEAGPEVAPPKEEGPEEEGLEEGEEEEAESPKKKILFFLLALFVPLVLLLAGLFTLWQLYQNPSLPPKEESAPKASPPPEPQKEPPLVSSPIAVEDRKILFLKDFLIPYRRETGEFVFVKAKVFLYFANSRDYELAKKNELLLREEIYRLFRNAPLYVWESKKGAEVIKKEIKEYLAKKKIGGVSPVDLEVTGYILE